MLQFGINGGRKLKLHWKLMKERSSSLKDEDTETVRGAVTGL